MNEEKLKRTFKSILLQDMQKGVKADDFEMIAK